MRVPHIYQASSIALNTPVSLNDDAAGHIGRVLRMKVGEHVSIFNGEGGEYFSEIIEVTKKSVVVMPQRFDEHDVESPLKIHLGQCVSRGDKMDFTIQKSVELGISEITPIFSQRCGVKLIGDRLDKKHQQWQKIAIAAAEQSGRNYVPVVHPPIDIKQWLEQSTNAIKLTLHPRAEHSIKTITVPKDGVRFLVGPEGGFTDEEMAQAERIIQIENADGPRVLRTETAALTVLSALQLQFGDLAN